MNWDEYFLRIAYLISAKSKDTSTKIGSVIVGENNQIISTGYNGMPIGVNDSDLTRYERPKKYFFFEHAERNALNFAARSGVSTNGASIYVIAPPCADCARSIIQSGIKKVIIHGQFDNIWITKKWSDSMSYANNMFFESGIPVRKVDLNLGIKTIIDGEEVNV